MGRYGYPKVRVGPMIPLIHGDTTIMAKEELWAGRSVDEIASYRANLIRGTSRVSVSETSGRYIETLQEMALSKKPVESEARVEKVPAGESELVRELRLSSNSAPFGPAIEISGLRVEAMSSDPLIQKAFYDGDLSASEGLRLLHANSVPVSALHRALSIGMIGLRKNRKLVPTRWSITATDDTISKGLVENLRDFDRLDSFRTAIYSHMGNRYAVVLFADSPWRFEFVEAWYNPSGGISIESDFERDRGPKQYPSTAGAYFAARLAVAEYLNRIRRTCSCLVLREVCPEYSLPLGVWQVREGVRNAFTGQIIKFENVSDAISAAFSKLSLSAVEILGRSRLYNDIVRNRKITDY